MRHRVGPAAGLCFLLSPGALLSLPPEAGREKAAVPWPTQREPPKTRGQVVAEMKAALNRHAERGFTGEVLLAQDGEILLHEAYGLAERSSGRPVTLDTGFDIGSLTKPFTTATVLKLESRGKLHRSDSIARFFPGAPPEKAPITVQELLAHSSGLPDIVGADSEPVHYVPDFDYEPVSRDEIVRRAMNSKLRFPPGERSEYSNLGFSLLGVIVEIASGEPYERYLQESVFQPAGMTRTGYLGPAWRSAQLAVGYRHDRPWGTPLDHPWLPDGPSWNLRANGGMLSTTGDLYRWILSVDGNALLSPAEKSAFFDLNVHRNKRGALTMGAAGSNEIFDACYLWYVDEHRVLVALTSSDALRAEDLVPDLAKTMLTIQTSAAPR